MRELFYFFFGFSHPDLLGSVNLFKLVYRPLLRPKYTLICVKLVGKLNAACYLDRIEFLPNWYRRYIATRTRCSIHVCNLDMVRIGRSNLLSNQDGNYGNKKKKIKSAIMKETIKKFVFPKFRVKKWLTIFDHNTRKKTSVQRFSILNIHKASSELKLYNNSCYWSLCVKYCYV